MKLTNKWIIFFFLLALLNEDVGLRFGDKNNSTFFPDKSFATSTEQFYENYPPWYGRLYGPIYAWCPENEVNPSYIELILVEKYHIFAVSVQGYWEEFDDSYFPTKYRIYYSDNYQDWNEYPSQVSINWNLGKFGYWNAFDITYYLLVEICE